MSLVELADLTLPAGTTLVVFRARPASDGDGTRYQTAAGEPANICDILYLTTSISDLGAVNSGLVKSKEQLLAPIGQVIPGTRGGIKYVLESGFSFEEPGGTGGGF